jgi:hypothetical protein
LGNSQRNDLHTDICSCIHLSGALLSVRLTSLADLAVFALTSDAAVLDTSVLEILIVAGQLEGCGIGDEQSLSADEVVELLAACVTVERVATVVEEDVAIAAIVSYAVWNV